LFAIPAAFFLATLEILRDVPREGLAEGVAAAYSFVPFMLAAGIAAFPLAAIESVFLAAFAFALQVWALEAGRDPLMKLAGLDSLWLLSLIAAVAAFAAMSQLRLLSALVQQGTRDPLTGCLRRESGTELLEMQFLLAARHGGTLAVLFADIDRFKRVNDEFGHEAGDRVLAGVAVALRETLRDSDVLVRWGGEEFVALLPRASRGEAAALIDRLRARGFGRMPDGRPITLSIGLAEYSADRSARALDLVALADQRMYAAKQAGRNRFVADDAGDAIEILDADQPHPASGM
jgi:diguanylate cyclase (GGDEF)-like protein